MSRREPPTSAAELKAWLSAADRPEEDHYLDFKAQLNAGPKENKELAKDLAQFALDGGSLVIGVLEGKEEPHTPVPVTLEGLRERVESVAQSRVDPPMTIRCHPLPEEDNPTLGYLWVEVPASPVAPHMIEGVYYGRGDTQKHRLSDADVLRLHDARRSQERDREVALRAWVDQDIPSHNRTQAHFHLVAAPLTAPPGLVDDFLDETPDAKLRALVREGVKRSRARIDAAYMLENAGEFSRTAQGIQLATFASPPDDESSVLIEVTDEGHLRVRMTRVSMEMDQGESAIWPDVAVVLARQCLGVVAELAVSTGYQGRWSVGAAVTDLSGHYIGRTTSHTRTPHLPDYYATTQASLPQLRDNPGTLTQALMKRFARSTYYERQQDVLDAFTDPEHGDGT